MSLGGLSLSLRLSESESLAYRNINVSVRKSFKFSNINKFFRVDSYLQE